MSNDRLLLLALAAFVACSSTGSAGPTINASTTAPGPPQTSSPSELARLQPVAPTIAPPQGLPVEPSAVARETRSTPAATVPLEWKRYATSTGAAIYVPSSWNVLPPAAIPPPYVFAASPDAPETRLADRALQATLLSPRPTRPMKSVDELADDILAGPLLGVRVERVPATHPAGPVVLLRYLVQQRDGSAAQQVDALWLTSGSGWILGTRTPLDQRERNAPVLVEIFQRFRPA